MRMARAVMFVCVVFCIVVVVAVVVVAAGWLFGCCALPAVKGISK